VEVLNLAATFPGIRLFSFVNDYFNHYFYICLMFTLVKLRGVGCFALLANYSYFWIGIAFLFLAKIKNRIIGYTPKPFSTEEIERCIKYDINIVNHWLKSLNEYSPDYTIQNKHILELGPVSDLGTGVYILSKNAKKYTAIDIYDLVSNVSMDFYNAFLAYLQEKEQANTSMLAEELNKTRNHKNDKLNYICCPDFNIIECIGDDRVDVIFSNAAFEHFTDFRKTIDDFSKVVSHGAILIVNVDLQTHSRWIREKDPNNIYRYPDYLYNLLSFCGSPNRARPYEYREALERNGWENIVIKPMNRLDDIANFQNHLDKKFKDTVNQMDYLSISIFAIKSGRRGEHFNSK
jgi:SAM-dependent methyltransferase